jgi:hypothetical protein
MADESGLFTGHGAAIPQFRTPVNATSATRNTRALGGGVEFGLSLNWSAKASMSTATGSPSVDNGIIVDDRTVEEASSTI